MELFLILGNQLFPIHHMEKTIKKKDDCIVFMREDFELCTYFKFHKQKISFFLLSMREYADELRKKDFKLHYEKLEKKKESKYEDSLENFLRKNKITSVVFFEIEDHFFERRIISLLEKMKIEYTIMQSPMFLTSRNEFKKYVALHKKPLMKNFYEMQRKKFQILMEGKEPLGGQWSFDTHNRKALPKNINPPKLPTPKTSPHFLEIKKSISDFFKDHPGEIDGFWLPVTRKDSMNWLNSFLKDRFQQFGPYEDALPAHSDFVFHSVLSPLLNIGLLTPEDVIQKSISYSEKHDIPIESLEGFIRQILGWREFIRGIYQNFGDQQQKMNFWGHTNKLSKVWYTGNTDIPILDRALSKAITKGYLHHIERLMVIGNLMVLLEIHPQEAYRWFMEMFVDSSDWVMGPNVYGMALYSDGGIFSTKPYICSSNYLLKMSGEKKDSWCDAIDGLYWSFIKKNKSFFSSNHRTSLAVQILEKIPVQRLHDLEKKAQTLREKLILKE